MNAVFALGPGDAYDRAYDEAQARADAIERKAAEFYADDEEVSEALTDFLLYMRRHKNDPRTHEAIQALRDGDHLHFGNLCAKAVEVRIDKKAADYIDDLADSSQD